MYVFDRTTFNADANPIKRMGFMNEQLRASSKYYAKPADVVFLYIFPHLLSLFAFFPVSLSHQDENFGRNSRASGDFLCGALKKMF